MSDLHFSSQAHADAYVITGKIETLRKKRGRTTHQEAQLIALQHQLSAINAPVYKLPDHVLSHIFELGSRYGQDQKYSRVVSQVTSRWRRVAISTPHLWSILRFDIPILKSRRAAPFYDLLERTKEVPLSLHVTVYPMTDRISVSGAFDLWNTLTLRCHEYHLHGVLREGEYFQELPVLAWHFLPSNVTSRLRYLKLCNIQLPTSFQLPDSSGLDILLGALKCCEVLESLKLQNIVIRRENVDYLMMPRRKPTPISMGALQTLVLSDGDVDSYCTVFPQIINAPLDTLQVRLFGFRNSFRGLIHQVNVPCFTSIRSCTLLCGTGRRLGALSYSRFFQVFFRMPNLKKMKICDPGFFEHPPSHPTMPITPFKSVLRGLTIDGGTLRYLASFVELLEEHGLERSKSTGRLQLRIVVSHRSSLVGDRIEWLGNNVWGLLYVKMHEESF